MQSTKPSERMSQLVLEIATKEVDLALKSHSITGIASLLGMSDSYLAEKREVTIKHMVGECSVFRAALLQYLDEEHDRVQKILELNKCL